MHERLPPPWQAAPACLLLLFCLGCAVGRSSPREFEYFVKSNPVDQNWYTKVEEWQQRSRSDAFAEPEYPLYDPADPSIQVPEGHAPPLRVQMDDFANAQQRQIARAVNEWSQRTSRWHYKKDQDDTAESDHWPTVGELLIKDGDDCDGLDLISYRLLLQFGFPRDSVYRAVFQRHIDGVNHMVTLWFESEDDPWVLDATRAASREMEKLSNLRGWSPIVMFNQERLYDIIEP